MIVVFAKMKNLNLNDFIKKNLNINIEQNKNIVTQVVSSPCQYNHRPVSTCWAVKKNKIKLT